MTVAATDSGPNYGLWAGGIASCGLVALGSLRLFNPKLFDTLRWPIGAVTVLGSGYCLVQLFRKASVEEEPDPLQVFIDAIGDDDDILEKARNLGAYSEETEPYFRALAERTNVPHRLVEICPETWQWVEESKRRECAGLVTTAAAVEAVASDLPDTEEMTRCIEQVAGESHPEPSYFNALLTHAPDAVMGALAHVPNDALAVIKSSEVFRERPELFFVLVGFDEPYAIEVLKGVPMREDGRDAPPTEAAHFLMNHLEELVSRGAIEFACEFIWLAPVALDREFGNLSVEAVETLSQGRNDIRKELKENPEIVLWSSNRERLNLPATANPNPKTAEVILKRAEEDDREEYLLALAEKLPRFLIPALAGFEKVPQAVIDKLLKTQRSDQEWAEYLTGECRVLPHDLLPVLHGLGKTFNREFAKVCDPAPRHLLPEERPLYVELAGKRKSTFVAINCAVRQGWDEDLIRQLRRPDLNITRVDEEGVPRLYVRCSSQHKTGAQELQTLFNKTVGGFEFSDPEVLGDRWATRTLCQLHLKTDIDATAGDRGNTVPHCFARVLNIAAARFPHTRIDPEVTELFEDKEWLDSCEVFAPFQPRLTGLKAFAEILKEGELKPADLLARIRARAADLEVSQDVQNTLVTGAYVPLLKALDDDTAKLN